VSGPRLLAGFADPSAASQRCFRAVLGALAEPGTAHPLQAPQESPAGCDSGLASLGLALLDASTPFYVSQLSGLSGYLRFHTGAPEATPATAQWAFASVADPGLIALAQSLSTGSLEYPESASTLVLQLTESPQASPALALKGPGIPTRRELGPLGLPPAFWAWRQAQRARYPLGIDLLFVSGSQVWGLPRSTEILLEAACMLP
jgi:alpha-D-ribose 1-methylphosphonate 5-triphosphate synthase subunit PhnH